MNVTGDTKDASFAVNTTYPSPLANASEFGYSVAFEPGVTLIGAPSALGAGLAFAFEVGRRIARHVASRPCGRCVSNT
eukprot:scaffold5719_cov272-Pinguiococcus_pyrenoidosus.AAC.1